MPALYRISKSRVTHDFTKVRSGNNNQEGAFPNFTLGAASEAVEDKTNHLVTMPSDSPLISASSGEMKENQLERAWTKAITPISSIPNMNDIQH